MMATLVWPAAALGVGVLFTCVSSRRRTNRLQDSEESAHALASERRSEHRYGWKQVPATAVLLGDIGMRMDCRIVDASRSGMRIALPVPMPVGHQVCVEWGSDFFVGTSRHVTEKNGEHITGLQLVTSSFRHARGPWRFLPDFASLLRGRN
jgi:hypothetical protein